MTDSVTDPAAASRRSLLPLPPGPLLGFALALAAVVLITFFRHLSMQAEALATSQTNHTLEVLRQSQAVGAGITEAETGQRGFLLTGDENYLAPYERSTAELADQIDRLRRLVSGDVRERLPVDALARAINAKLEELRRTVELRRSGEAATATAMVRTGRGKALMDQIRGLLAQIDDEERSILASRQAAQQHTERLSYLVSLGGSALLLVLIAAAAAMFSQDYRARQRLTWIRTGQAHFATRIQGERRLEQLGEQLLGFLAQYLDVQVGAVFTSTASGEFRRVAGYAVPSGEVNDAVRPGEGLLGQAARDRRLLHVRDVPRDYWRISSSLGSTAPRELLVVPAVADGFVHAVLELGFLRRIESRDTEFLERIAEALGVAVRSSRDRTRLEELLAETQRQAEELQQQQEELRVANEELEVQSRTLKDSQTRLEQQHAELEQSNAELEEQTQLLGDQKDALVSAQLALVAKASELSRANQYKSEFLANMSHELRTPLNSALILAKILADNKAGNLTADQVKYARTIISAGNELLSLVNDVLDLSKIEAGRVEIQPQRISLARMLEEVAAPFEALAKQKGLDFKVVAEPHAPESIETDPQRVGQILRNLVSNALKFTEHGHVHVRAAAEGAGAVRFTVSDSGIGIAPDEHEVIFEAFRQADGTTHRRYGGTGLGLSISRDLARLLGGDISVQSTPGLGSTFTLQLPIVHATPVAAEEEAALQTEAANGQRLGRIRAAGSTVVPEPAGATRVAAGVRSGVTSRTGLAGDEWPETHPGVGAGNGAGGAQPLLPRFVPDDRERLAGASKIALIVEDDARFAEILRDLAHEKGYACIITASAADALRAAQLYSPHAVLLDINLPDSSGLVLLDQLKRSADTRHIPVHVASVSDHAREALERGAVGYVLKPVKREELVVAFDRLEAKLAQRMRRVLVVEDDPHQRESIRGLLSNGEVEITAVATAREALEALARAAFDCVVMDINLPDRSGYELLEDMARQTHIALAPVIVYTAGSLTRDEEQRLRRFSSSIIIKDARSPERLLDEVTLFLHQVESRLPIERQRMLRAARDRDAVLEGRRILVVEDDVRNIFALSCVLEPKGANLQIARNGREALAALERSLSGGDSAIDLVLMDLMMPEMDGLTAMREIRARREWKRLPIIALTAKAMPDDREQSIAAGANDYIAKPLDVDKLLSLVRVWMPR